MNIENRVAGPLICVPILPKLNGQKVVLFPKPVFFVFFSKLNYDDLSPTMFFDHKKSPEQIGASFIYFFKVMNNISNGGEPSFHGVVFHPT